MTLQNEPSPICPRCGEEFEETEDEYPNFEVEMGNVIYCCPHCQFDLIGSVDE